VWLELLAGARRFGTFGMRRKCKNLSNSYEAGRNCRTTHDAISPKNV
jgi:hypothetical protein